MTLHVILKPNAGAAHEKRGAKAMYLPKDAGRLHREEAEKARQNRQELAIAFRKGDVTRRNLLKWGVIAASGALLAKNGLTPFARSAFGAVPTGLPPSPRFNAKKFTQPLHRPISPAERPLSMIGTPGKFAAAAWPADMQQLPAMRLSYHHAFCQDPTTYVNPVTGVGPIEGRPPGEFFAHQRWQEQFPKYGYVLSLGQIKAGARFAPEFPEQDANSVWTFGPRPPGLVGAHEGSRTGIAAPILVKARYGEPFICRIYNDLPVDREHNNGFGRNEASTHLHNSHNGAESDGACNAFHFPGTFYDYRWSCKLARGDMPNLWLKPGDTGYRARAASGPDDGEGLVDVAGDFRELQGSLWFHDHRFFFTAENVYKGHVALMNMYSGPDRGREGFNDGVNLNLPSGRYLKYGNTDFDVNLVLSNVAHDTRGQRHFDIFDTDGFLGDMILVNGGYYPYMEVLRRRYRFRLLNGAVARFVKLAWTVMKSSKFSKGTAVPMYFIANDGNFVVKPIKLSMLDEQGPAERYDVVIDFSKFNNGDIVHLVNLLEQDDGRKPRGALSISSALKGSDKDPCVGSIMEFRIVDALDSVDDPTKRYNINNAADRDQSVDFEADTDWASGAKRLTEQVPIVTPTRERHIRFVREEPGDSRMTPDGECVPDCGEYQEFPWAIKVSGRTAHALNGNRISMIVPKPGDVEHWTMENSSGGWDHPIHLHFEEGVTISRSGGNLPETERLVRKDVWRLRPNGTVKMQVRFGEFGGSYVTHCHNTTHEDFAMLMRIQLLTEAPGTPGWRGEPQYMITDTPLPTPSGVRWMKPEILAEGDPSNPEFKKRSN